MSSAELAGYWTFDGDTEDGSGDGNHGASRGVTFVEGTGGGRAARFDGRTSQVEIARSPIAGVEEFSLAMAVRTDEALDDVLGDLMSEYDPDSRVGFNLGIQVAQGVTSHQPNYRNLYFGVDAGTSPVWRECGRPGNSLYAMALATHKNRLYVGTFETGADEAGHVYVYEGGQTWKDCGSPDRSNAVSSLAEYEGELYAGTSRYRAGGSALPESPNQHPGGRIYRYAGGEEWVDCGALPDADSVLCFAVFKGNLYAIPLYSQGVFRYEGGTEWKDCGTPGRRLMSIAVYNGELYATGNEGGGVFRYRGGTEWEACGFQEGMTQIYSFAVHHGGLYIGAWPEARVYRFDGEETWEDSGLLGQEKEVMGMMVYNGKLYAGTLPTAEVYRYDGATSWTRLQQLDMTPDVRYRRAWSMAVYQGRLYCGTLPSGRVFSMEAGKCVTFDDTLPSGWRHVAVTKSTEEMKLFVDGKRVAVAQAENLAQYRPAADRPLKIGVGAIDHFKGDLQNVRVYRGVLTDAEVAELAQSDLG